MAKVTKAIAKKVITPKNTVTGVRKHGTSEDVNEVVERKLYVITRTFTEDVEEYTTTETIRSQIDDIRNRIQTLQHELDDLYDTLAQIED